MIDIVRDICDEYAEQGFDLTLRQLYYQCVSRGYIPNNDKEYGKLGDLVNDARLAGELDWNHIVDRGRNLQSYSHWRDASHGIQSIAEQFAIDKWRTQDNRVEVWVEKEALIGVVEHACEPLDVAHFACKGYVSQSEMWAAAQRMSSYCKRGYAPHIIHLGDHDPSGIDMSRDIQDRLNLFMEDTRYPSDEEVADGERGVDEVWPQVKVHRIALNMDQVREYDPPPNPAKITDSRAVSYIDRFGQSSWELDALNPTILNDLITDAVTELRDERRWNNAVKEERQTIEALTKASKNWHTVERFVQGLS